MKRIAPATARNRAPILEILRPLLRDGATVLELASGSGEHAVFFAKELPKVVWQPSDSDVEACESIEAHRVEAGLPNLRPPVAIDVRDTAWGVAQADAIVCVNMIHISPWETTVALMAGAGRLLDPGGVLFLYGPYRVGSEAMALSNVAFDEDLRARNVRWGIRQLDDVTRLAEAAGLARRGVFAMPANNLSIVFERVAERGFERSR